MRNKITALYADLNPDILEGIQDHIADYLDLNLSVYDIINAYFNKHPGDDLQEAAEALKDTNSIASLEDFYDLVDYMAEAAGLL